MIELEQYLLLKFLSYKENNPELRIGQAFVSFADDNGIIIDDLELRNFLYYGVDSYPVLFEYVESYWL